ncbi:hypothetical protein RM69_07845, partial [Mesotoga sp. SC_NapDC3]
LFQRSRFLPEACQNDGKQEKTVIIMLSLPRKVPVQEPALKCTCSGSSRDDPERDLLLKASLQAARR